MKVLFIGNSHTYFNDMPYIFAYLSAARGRARAAHHADPGRRVPEEPRLQRAGALQPALRGIRPVRPAGGGERVPRRGGLPHQRGNPLVLRQGGPSARGAVRELRPGGRKQRQDYLCQTVEGVGQALGLPVAKAGRAFALCQERYPQIDLYFTDRRHASPAGSYLVALTLLRFLLGLDVRGLPDASSIGAIRCWSCRRKPPPACRKWPWRRRRCVRAALWQKHKRAGLPQGGLYRRNMP